MAPCWPPKSTKNASWSSLGGSWALLEASSSVLEASWNVLEASWSVLGASLGVLGPKINLLQEDHVTRGIRIAAPAGRRELITSKEEGRLRKGDYRKSSGLCRPGYSELRHAARRLRAWCGSKAQQSCDPATALTF